MEANLLFTLEAGLAAPHWLEKGYG